jgi:hypothetical protein
MPEADDLAAEGRAFRYEPFYCFNGHHLWEIFPDGKVPAKGRTLERYYRTRQKRVNMRRMREVCLPGGKAQRLGLNLSFPQAKRVGNPSES